MRRSPRIETERFLTFEAESTLYALPIAEVHEVAEASRVCCVPTCSPARVGVMNWHGDALPVVSAPLLLGANWEGTAAGLEAEVSEPARQEKPSGNRGLVGGAHVLVVSSRDDEPAQLGLPIDRVIGLADGPRQPRGKGEMVAEVRPIDGCSVSVLDPCRLVERATKLIEGVS